MTAMKAPPLHTVGIGLKPKHYADLFDAKNDDRPGWVEVHPQNYWGPGGDTAQALLSQVAEIVPISFHSVGLSLGSADGLNGEELERLAALCDRIRPATISDHLSFSGNAHDRLADLLPLPYSFE
ncbi:MAG: multinuclear nonheme iron-dependent oxidase, partial [Sphingorhabdus sp.]